MNCIEATNKIKNLRDKITRAQTVIDERNRALEADIQYLTENQYDPNNLQPAIDDLRQQIQSDMELVEADLNRLSKAVEDSAGAIA